MALFNETPLSQLLPDEAPTDDDFYSDFNEVEAANDYEEVAQAQEIESVPAVEALPPAQRKSKTSKPRVVLKDRVLSLK